MRIVGCGARTRTFRFTIWIRVIGLEIVRDMTFAVIVMKVMVLRHRKGSQVSEWMLRVAPMH